MTYSSLFNRYNGTVFLIMITMFLSGIFVGIFINMFWGLLLITFSAMMNCFWSAPKDKPPEVRLVTFLGPMTTQVVTKASLYFPGIVGFTSIDTSIVDKDFYLKKPIQTLDGSFLDPKLSYVSLSVTPDTKDNSTDNMTAGEKLRAFVTNGEMKGVFEQLDDIINAWVESVASEMRLEELTMKGINFEERLLKFIDGRTSNKGNNPSIDDSRGLGIKFTKIQVVFSPPQRIVDAAISKMEEEYQRKAELVENETIQQSVNARLEGMGHMKDGKWISNLKQAERDVLYKEIRRQVFDERLAHSGKYQVVENKGGANIANLGGSEGGSK